MAQFKDRLAKSGFNIVSAQLAYLPKEEVAVQDTGQLTKLIDELDENEDVQEIFYNFKL